MECFQRKDFIYLKFLDDYKTYKKGQIIRYNKEWLLKYMFNYNDQEDFNKISFHFNPNASEDELSFEKLFDSITVLEDTKWQLLQYTSPNLRLNKWLIEHFDNKTRNFIDYVKKSGKYNTYEDIIIFPLDENNYGNEDFCPYTIMLNLKKGEKLDFSDIAIRKAFYFPNIQRIINHCSIITGDEKEKLFQEDFSNAFFDYDPVRYSEYVNDKDLDALKNMNKLEYHAFKEKIDSDKSLLEFGYESLFNKYEIDYATSVTDENTGLEYIFIGTDTTVDSSERRVEQDLMKFMDRVPKNEAQIVFKKETKRLIKKGFIKRFIEFLVK